MTDAVHLDQASGAEHAEPALASAADAAVIAKSVAGGDGLGCHAGKDELKKAAEAAGKSETLARYAKDYPVGPHDQP